MPELRIQKSAYHFWVLNTQVRVIRSSNLQVSAFSRAATCRLQVAILISGRPQAIACNLSGFFANLFLYLYNSEDQSTEMKSFE